MHRCPRWTTLVVLAIGIATVSSSAEAARLDPRELTARKEYAAGRYPQAVELFAELFAETGDPIFLRNIARSYQKMRRPDEAISNFQEYLAKGNVSAKERAEILSYVDEMKALKRQRASTATTSTTPPRAPAESSVAQAPSGSFVPPPMWAAPAGSPPPISSAPNVTGASAPTPDATRAADGHSGWKTAGIATAIGGGALLATGVGFGLAASSAGMANSQQANEERDKAGKRYETLQWVAYGVGAAVIAAGGLMFVYGPRNPETSTGIRVAVSAWPPQLGMEGRF